MFLALSMGLSDYYFYGHNFLIFIYKKTPRDLLLGLHFFMMLGLNPVTMAYYLGDCQNWDKGGSFLPLVAHSYSFRPYGLAFNIWIYFEPLQGIIERRANDKKVFSTTFYSKISFDFSRLK